MAIRKREFKTGVKWFVDVYYPDGKRLRRIVGSKKQAEEIERRINNKISEGKWELRDTEITFRELLLEYLEYAKASKSEKTYGIDKYRIEAHLLPYFADMPIKSITPHMIDNYKSKRVREEASNNTVNHELVNLSHMMKMAVRWQYIDRNPVSSVERLRVSKQPPRFLSLEEIEKLIEASQESYIYPIVMTALHTGMRKSELLNLKLTDINFDQLIINIQAKKDWHTKNYRSRIAFITPVLYDVLQEHIKQQDDSGVKSEYVFTYNGKKIKGSIEDSLRTVVGKAGLKDVTLHVLRHTFASQLAIAGVPLRAIQELMGHQSTQTTLQYAHLSEEHMKKQVLRLPFSGSSETSKARIRHVTENSIDSQHQKGLVLTLQSK